MSTAADTRPSVQPRLRARALVILAAIAAGLVVWVVAVPLAGLDLTVGAEPQRVGPIAVVVVSLLAGVAGTALLTLLERVARRPRSAWLIVSLAVLLLSLAGPLGATSAAATVALACMHLAVGLSIAAGLARTSR